jgi:hypothetical protein
MKVIDGQHRLEAARNLNLPVFYQINEEATHYDIALLNSNMKRWANIDYVNYYASLGKQSYINLKNFCIENKVTPSIFIQLLKGDRQNNLTKIKTGVFDLEQTDVESFKVILYKVDEVINLIKNYLVNEPSFLTGHRFKRALFTFMKNPEVDIEILKKKIGYKADAIRPCADALSYYNTFRDIYNWKNSKPLESEPEHETNLENPSIRENNGNPFDKIRVNQTVIPI